MSVLRFSDGMEIPTDGPYRVTRRSDGLYVVGNGMLVPVDNEMEAQELLTQLRGSKQEQSGHGRQSSRPSSFKKGDEQMGKKAKKAAAQVEGQVQETTNQTAEEAQTMEIAQPDVQEAIPATIVEAGVEEVFGSQPEGQEAAEAATTPQEPKKEKTDRRPYIAYLTEALSQPQDRKILLKAILEKWPNVSKGGVQTFLTDMLNPKYSHFKDRPVVKLPDGKVVFADKAPVAVAEEVQEAPAEEVVTPTDEACEQPAE